MLENCFSAWILFLLCFVFVKYHCQICTKRVVVTRWQQQSYQYTYRETYRGQCWYGCIKTRIGSFTDNRIVPRKIVETREICCNGYIDVSNTSERIECDPICMPSCVNSTCQMPGVCTCNDGYTRDAVGSHICKPICSNDCLHGTCVAPNNCQCDFGYSLKNETCEPICPENCYNGTCVAPDTCECLPGFRSSENNLCKPYCSRGCSNGDCIAPETCSCYIGWLKNETSNSCIPQCETPCGNGTCVAPNKCECFNGYEIDPNYNESLSSKICVPKCQNCVNGTCVTPDECICQPPFMSKFLTNSSKDCCIDNCSNTSLKCEGTICVLEETKPSTMAPYSTTKDLITKQSKFYSKSDPSESTTELSATTMFYNFFNASSKEILVYTKSLLPESDKTNLTKSSTESSIFVKTTHEIYYYSNNTNFTKNYVSMKNENNSDWISMWIYILIALFVLIVFLVIIIVAKKNFIARWFKGGSYVVQDDKFKDVSSPTHTMDMT